MMLAAGFVTLLLWQQTAAGLYDDAKALFARGELEQARTAVEQSLRIDPRQLPALTLKARLALAGNQTDVAEQVLKTALKVDPSSAYARFLLGLAYYLENDFEKARDTLAAADQNDSRVLLYRGLTEEGLNNPDSAVAYYQHALEIDPRSVDTRISYARLLVAGGKWLVAENLIDQALRIDSGDSDALYEKLRCLVARHDFSEAAKVGEHALETSSSQLQQRRIRYQLVRCYEELGDKAMAEKHRAAFEKLPNPLVR